MKPAFLATLEEGTHTIQIIPNITAKNKDENVLSGDFVVTNATLKNRTPQTGDNSNIALWIALMAISALSFVALGRKSRFN